MNRYAVLLRGINIGSRKLPMGDLRRLAEDLGYTGASTILATGNLLVKTNEDGQTVRQRICDALGAYMRQPIHCLVRSREQIDRLLGESDAAPEGYHHYILLCDEPVLDELQRLHKDYALDEGEKLFGASNDLHWIVRKGNTLKGFGSAVLDSRRYQAILTSRNLNTVEKIARGLKAL